MHATTVAAPKQHITRFPNGMEIELDLSVTRPAGNLTFTSTESDAVFILLGHLPGISQEKIEVSVNESEGQICISGAGDKSSLETVVGRRLRLKNEFETGSFKKVFRIPNGVVLDQIEVVFDEEEGILVILMPKLSKGEVLGRAIEGVEDKEDEGITKPEADEEAPEQEKEKESEQYPTRREDELIPEPEVDDAKATKKGEVKEIEEKLKPNGAESSRTEEGNGERGPSRRKDVEAKTEIPQEKGEVAETRIYQPEEETKINQDEVEQEKSEINQVVEAAETKIDQEEEKEKTESKIQQEEEKEKEEGHHIDAEIHQEDIEKDEKEEESREQLDAPEEPLIQIKPSYQDEQPAPKPMDTGKDEAPIRGESDQHRQPENKDERPRSIAAETDHDFEQRKEEQQTDQDHLNQNKNKRGSHQPEQKQAPPPTAEPKSDGGDQQSDRTPEMDEPIEEEGKEGLPEDGEKGKGPRKEDNRRRRKPRVGGGGERITPPMLVASAFLLSLVGLLFRLLRNRRRR